MATVPAPADPIGDWPTSVKDVVDSWAVRAVTAVDRYGFAEAVPSPAGDRCPVCLERLGAWRGDTMIAPCYIEKMRVKHFQPCGCTVEREG